MMILKFVWLILFVLSIVFFYRNFFSMHFFKCRFLNAVLAGIFFCGSMLFIYAVTKTFIFEPFKIPSESMENTIYPNDVILADKLTIKMQGIKHGQVYVFKDEKRNFFVKRCIALSGDRLEIIADDVYINGKKQPLAPGVKTAYRIFVKDADAFEKHIGSLRLSNAVLPDSLALLTENDKLRIRQFSGEISITKEKSRKKTLVFEKDKYLTSDTYGPVVTPKKGMKIPLNHENYTFYRNTILRGEGVSITEIKGKYYVNGIEETIYTFKYDYVFVLGDNRENSVDSRFTGFIRVNSIVGKADLILFSGHDNALHGSRFLKPI